MYTHCIGACRNSPDESRCTVQYVDINSTVFDDLPDQEQTPFVPRCNVESFPKIEKTGSRSATCDYILLGAPGLAGQTTG